MHSIIDTWKLKENKLGYKNQYKKNQNIFDFQKEKSFESTVFQLFPLASRWCSSPDVSTELHPFQEVYSQNPLVQLARDFKVHSKRHFISQIKIK